MNDLNLRVSGGIGQKVKKPAAPISMPYWNTEITGAASEFFNAFLGCHSADSQLKLMKNFLNTVKDKCDQETMRFLVLLFWHADAKHPVKGFLKKHVSDSRILCQPFTGALTSVISTEIKETSTSSYHNYIGTTARLDTCVDKFPPGAAAVSTLEVEVALYLLQCLEICLTTLGINAENICSDGKPQLLAPTEINKINDLVHLTLRLLLYMIQKVTDKNRGKLSSKFEDIRSMIDKLMSANEVPMDTKSVSGIIYLTMHLFENGPNSWVELLSERRADTARLAVCSAVATVVPAAELLAAQLGSQPAVLALTDTILDLGDRYCSESSHILAVARTMLALSKLCAGAGAALVRRLARWSRRHADHPADSVRHLAAQAAARVVRAAVALQTEGDPSALDELFASLSAMDDSRRSYYVTLTALADELGGGLVARRPDVIRDVIRALNTQAVQACATTFLETLLNKQMRECDTESIYQQWVVVILETVKCESDPTVLHILEKILTRAVQGDSGVLGYILPEERALNSYKGSDLKCVLLVLGVVRKSGVKYKRVSFEHLMHTAYDADDEVRALGLALAAECPRSTQPLARAELAYALHFLHYNVNAQSPSFRQLVLALTKKILKRLEDSYKVLKRTETEHATEIACYLKFVEDLREQCFNSLVAGSSYGRRCAALHILTWLHALQLDGWEKCWTEEQAATLYNLLEDSYENNKALALDVLKDCPLQLIKPVHSAGFVRAALAQAARPRPAHCAAAACKLLLLLALPVHVEPCHEALEVPEPRHFSVLRRILRELSQQTARAEQLARAARDAPMYGLVHCLARVLGCLDPRSIAGSEPWSDLVREVIAACELVNSRVASVVTAASPEGLLPHELTDTHTDTGAAGRGAGRVVSAQMLLLCAWRSVKETSLLLGSLVSRLALEGEAAAWSLSARQVRHVGQLLAALLARARHRGAFEQAYVGFARLLARLWSCSSAELHQLPLQWFAAIERDFARPAGEDQTEYCATRRGAGLPFMIQALVTTELAAERAAPRGRLLARCLRVCLSVGRAPPSPEAAARAHVVMRALYRHTVPSAEHTQEAIMVAVRGFEADTWMERNSSTLLFAALCVRVFGVPRARSRMTGRVFFLRYPLLYDFLLDQVRSASPDLPGCALRPALFPALLLLARLYPSALEGTVSNLKLERFLPHLVQLAGARDAHTRRLAARAAAPLVPPHRYVSHVLSLLAPLADPAAGRNLCHGLLCQLGVLLDVKPELAVDEQPRGELLRAARGTFWIAAHAHGRPCYLVADQWLAVLNLMLLRFPKLLDDDLPFVSSQLDTAVFSAAAPAVASGREVFLSDAVYMLLIIATTVRAPVAPLVKRALLHDDYEVNLAALNYLLILHKRNEDNCQFLEHLSRISNEDTLQELQTDGEYVELLCKLTAHYYLECKQKALKVLACTNGTQKDIVRTFSNIDVELTDEFVMAQLIDRVRNAHANLTSIYLESLLRLASETRVSLEVIRVLYECSSAGNEECAREAVASFLETRLKDMMTPTTRAPEDAFEWRATLASALAILLEDDAAGVRLRAASAVMAVAPDTHGVSVVAAHAARQWRQWAAGEAALLLVLAALDFRADLESADELGEEYRVFEQNETHNVYLEEFTWTRDCATELKRIYTQTYAHTHTMDEFIQSLLYDPVYKHTIKTLCVENVAQCLMRKMKSSNPKIDLLLKILHK